MSDQTILMSTSQTIEAIADYLNKHKLSRDGGEKDLNIMFKLDGTIVLGLEVTLTDTEPYHGR